MDGHAKTDFAAQLEEVSSCKFIAQAVPKPHSAFESYIVEISPRSGLSWIKAIGKTLESNSFGIELKTAFELMEQKLVTAYGQHERFDFLMHGSIWDEPRDWMQALNSTERVLMSQWSNETGASLKDGLSSLALVVGALNTSTGYIAIEYSFQNKYLADAEIAELEDGVL